MQLQDLFEANLGTIERVISIVCWRARLFGPDAEDFASEAKLALIENDYAILAKYEGRSSLDTFLTVVIQRLLADSRTKAKGRWHASTEASRLGPAAVLVETLILRDGRSLDEAMPHIQATHPELTRESVIAILDRLPQRNARPRAVDLEAVAHVVVAQDSSDARAFALDRKRISDAAGNAVRELLEKLAVDDRMLLRLRFASDMSIADISRMMQLPQRPLYRRLEALLRQLRDALTAAGIDAATAEALVGRDDEREMDFGLMNGKNENTRRSIDREDP
ncbi:MAG TPA: sigma-70 family RNA polymerase sigma factor [Thermoanaerobaculia bacterium]|nr:sigma-70 family RNA polymerase sigma factor [Thermoanaerobaculia bacterium]